MAATRRDSLPSPTLIFQAGIDVGFRVGFAFSRFLRVTHCALKESVPGNSVVRSLCRNVTWVARPRSTRWLRFRLR